jgi:formate dehydrogenase gamma subunit
MGAWEQSEDEAMKGACRRTPALARLVFKLLAATAAMAVPPVLAETPPVAPHGGDSQAGCLDCHGERDLPAETPRGRTLRLWVDPQLLRQSVHADLDCTDCHGGQKTWQEAPHNDGKPLTDRCAECHEREDREYAAGIHGQMRRSGKLQKAPDCRDCHGGHDIAPVSSSESRVSPLRQPETCGRCHGDDRLVLGDGIAKRLLVERYMSGVHWGALQAGKKAASCSDCHGLHDVRPSSEAESRVSPTGLVATCGRCHPAQARLFSEGSHGSALLHGNLDVPTCITCHGDHETASLRAGTGGKRDFAGTEICMWCHGNARMMARYALDTSPVESYLGDFHGLTQRGTSGASATCADCHDAHHSLPATHPQSRMHITNRGTTCGKCHGQSNESFIMSFTHRTSSVPHGGQIQRVISWIYTILIFLVIGGMLVHNLIVWRHALRRKLEHQRANAFIVRLNRFERLWHWGLFLSFLLLAVTGFALRYPDSLLFRWMYALGMSEWLRAMVHRLAAAVLVVSMAAFLAYQIFWRSGRRWFRDMLPRLSDVREFWANMRYHLGAAAQRPRFGVFSYVEKAEYWALVWGTGIMLVTGLLLAFSKYLPRDWPEWIIDLARLIHFFEAVLAVLAILVWHLFSAVFHYDEYPMDTSWLTGVITEEEARRRFSDAAILAHAAVVPASPAHAEPESVPAVRDAAPPEADGASEGASHSTDGETASPSPESPEAGEEVANTDRGSPATPADDDRDQ